jgi:hypothetical protein
MPRAEFELAIQATKRPQSYALDRAATGIVLPTGPVKVQFMILPPLITFSKRQLLPVVFSNTITY